MIDHIYFAIFLFVFIVGNHLVFGYGGYWFFYKHVSADERKVVDNDPRPGQIKEEQRRSRQTVLIFFLQALALYALHINGYSKVLAAWDELGVLYFGLSFLILHLAHDAYFYWTHRMMHEWDLLKGFHRIHHRSTTPTPFSSLCFHPVEAFIQGFFWFMVIPFIPLPAFAIFGFYCFIFFANMWGHMNYEFWHSNHLDRFYFKIISSTTHHILHHRYNKNNYGLYYMIWDWMCGTTHPEYEAHFRSVKKKRLRLGPAAKFEIFELSEPVKIPSRNQEAAPYISRQDSSRDKNQ